MWTDVFCRKVKIEVKGPKDHKLLIIKSSTPGRHAKKPRVFWGGDNKTMPASFSNSALLMSYVIIATVHDGNGEVLETFNLPNSFLPYKRFVFHLEAPYRFDKIPITCWLEDLLRFFVRRKKSQEPDNIPTVPKSSTPPFLDLVPVASYYEPNGSCSCEMNGGHLLSNTDESHQSSSGSSQDLSEGGSYTFEINGDHLLLKTDVTDQSSLSDFYNREMNGDHLLSETDDTDQSSSPKSSTPPFLDLVPVAPYYEPNGSRSCEMNGGHLLLNTDELHQSSSGGSYTCEINEDHLLLETDVTDQSSLNDFYNREMNGYRLLSETDDTDLSSYIENSSPQMSPNSVSDTAFLPKSVSQRTDESCGRGSSSNHTPYYDADTSPFCDSYSPHSSHVPLDRSARNMGSRSFSEILGNTWKELKGIMDLQGG